MTRRGGVSDRFDQVFAKVQETEAQQLAAMRGEPEDGPAPAADEAPSAAGDRTDAADEPRATAAPAAVDDATEAGAPGDGAAEAVGEGSAAPHDRRTAVGDTTTEEPPAADRSTATASGPAGGTTADGRVGERAAGGPPVAGRRDESGYAADGPPPRPRPPAPIAKVSDDPDDWRELDHALARNADDPSQWDRSTFRTSAWLADGLAVVLKRRRRRLRLGGGERMQFAATDRHMRKVLSLQLLTNLPLGDLDELESLLRRGFEEGWFDDDDASAYLEVTAEMRDALDAVVARLRQRGMKRVGLRHVQILALVYGIDPDEPVVERSEAAARLEQLLR